MVKLRMMLVIAFSVVVAGCSVSTNVDFTDVDTSNTVTAIGLGVLPQGDKYSEQQAHLLAVKASKIDAYRSLVEKIYGVKVSSSSTVRSLAIESDSFKAKVEGMIQMAEVEEVKSVMDGLAYETTMSVKLTPEFRSYVLNGKN
ncbi:LPP20 family lipoprotein [Pseudoalteromonas marina]|uniref:LPP20 family lipoprotein n=1 Tax=Pseudoalteromonas marina TaxID=267375 RepID=A0ABT9FC99_9GAMM|nr:LPP20 family lipoprotein [Pseudoalteromonas marina]MDP2564363.1 LPP20 family lipoprotein [Pseudoalteromonas marina]